MRKLENKTLHHHNFWHNIYNTQIGSAAGSFIFKEFHISESNSDSIDLLSLSVGIMRDKIHFLHVNVS